MRGNSATWPALRTPIEFVPLSDTEQSSVLAAHPRISAADSGSRAARGDFSHRRSAHRNAVLLGQLSELAAQNILISQPSRAHPELCMPRFLPKREEQRRPRAGKAVERSVPDLRKPEIGASAMLEWCPAEVKRAAGGVWGPARKDFALMQRVKNVFDPQNVLSPGRFAGGI